MRISDWSSDVCSSDLDGRPASRVRRQGAVAGGEHNFGLMPPSRSLADASNVHRLHDHWIQRAMSLSSVTAFLLLSGATPPTVDVPAETQTQTERQGNKGAQTPLEPPVVVPTVDDRHSPSPAAPPRSEEHTS